MAVAGRIGAAPLYTSKPTTGAPPGPKLSIDTRAEFQPTCRSSSRAAA
jgi:hypothetical protein